MGFAVRLRGWLPLLALLLPGLLAAQPSQKATVPSIRLVYHLDYLDSTRQYVALLSIENQWQAQHAAPASVRPSMEVVVVLQSDGVTLLRNALTEPRLAQKVDSLRRLGVRFLVSQSSLTRWNLEAGALYKVPAEDVVANGLVEIAQRQMQGFIYIKP